ncbi:putative DNA-binding ribbon-helix-helix protein [Paenochrobactrum gallinarii]|uniref:Putative DNA-binding ribbon-helix-helix protein n=1 Tax=Paenochrobactrum gallinarii TaxID=643673 RepID=A0A841M104_9HYPH|nr:ribbon-helix-helix domain-containing protein [Paenochrobactrum gallinarii]MBB6259808.1 putative DNA-binding ribbon-helix-helix protein [Paenochrobactrum gallinarii]
MSKLGAHQLKKHSVTIRGHSTSFTLEDAFYHIICNLAEQRKMALAALIAEIDGLRPEGCNLSSALRLYALQSVLREETAQAD